MFLFQSCLSHPVYPTCGGHSMLLPFSNNKTLALTSSGAVFF
uniref:Uncharacterized protein n=1 Tax=Octopus bimaculoides TaxID=37653 RepID=A0A0L8GP62_OCTBM